MKKYTKLDHDMGASVIRYLMKAYPEAKRENILATLIGLISSLALQRDFRNRNEVIEMGKDLTDLMQETILKLHDHDMEKSLS